MLDQPCQITDIVLQYEKIKVNFRVKSDAPREKIMELVDLAQKRSPVFDIVSNPTTVEVSLQE